MASPVVSIVRYDGENGSSFGRALELAGLGGIVSRGDKVLLKPNQHGGHGFTNPDVLKAGARWAFEAGAAEVWIGDGPVWCMLDAGPYFTQTGLRGACEATGAKELNFHAGQYRVIHPDCPDLPETVGFSEYLYEADVVINLPVMKTHFNTLVTLGIKNLKGCIRPIDKKTLHEMELNAGIAEVCRLVAERVTATVVDASIGYEGMGPGGATEVDVGLLLASDDVVAVDTVACHLMGIEACRSRLIRFCAERGVGEMDIAKITIVGEDPAAHRRQFKLPYRVMAEEFPNLRLCTEQACSGCAMNLLRAMEIARNAGQEVIYDTVAIGPRVETEGRVLLVGNCTRPGWDTAPHVKGCPPTVDAIRAAMTGIEGDETVPRS